MTRDLFFLEPGIDFFGFFDEYGNIRRRQSQSQIVIEKTIGFFSSEALIFSLNFTEQWRR
jgi:hypothetical protein